MSLNARLSTLEMKLGIIASSSDGTNKKKNDPRHQMISDMDVASRLDALQGAIEKSMTTSTTTNDLKTSWMESCTLLKELDPGEGLTYQQQPLLYKRQELLAVAPQLKQDFQHLSTLIGLLHTTPSSAASGIGGGGIYQGQQRTMGGTMTTTGDGSSGTGGKPPSNRPPPSSSTSALSSSHHRHTSSVSSAGSSGSTSYPTPLTEDVITQASVLTTTTFQISMEDQRRLDTLKIQMEDLNQRTQKVMIQFHQMLEIYHVIMTAASEKCILFDETLRMREETTI